MSTDDDARVVMELFTFQSTTRGQQYKNDFMHQYFDNQYERWKIEIREIENVTKKRTVDRCRDYWVFNEIHQGQVFSSSAFCEPFGSTLKRYVSSSGGRPRDFENVAHSARIAMHVNPSKSNIHTLASGTANNLVDEGKGV
eukprot:313783_1